MTDLARRTDPITSHQGPFKRESQCRKLLEAYGRFPEGLSDFDAADFAGIRMGGWKRCSDLRNRGLIAATETVEMGPAGRWQMVCVITEAGKRLL